MAVSRVRADASDDTVGARIISGNLRLASSSSGGCKSTCQAIGSLDLLNLGCLPVPYVFLLFVGIPILEIMLFIKVGSAIGTPITIGIVILTAILGSWLLRQQGLATLNSARSRIESGQIPASEVVEGMLLLVGGALLLTPGFFTDGVGFLCLFPYSRQVIAQKLASRFKVATLTPGAGSAGAGQPYGPSGGSGPGPSAETRSTRPRPGYQRGANAGDDVIEGEFREED